MKSALPVAIVLIALLAFWYVAAALMNAPLQRDVFANAGRDDYSTADLVAASLNMERPKLPAPHQIVAELDKLILETPPTSKRGLVYHACDHLAGDADRLLLRRWRSGSAWRSWSSRCAASSDR